MKILSVKAISGRAAFPPSHFERFGSSSSRPVQKTVLAAVYSSQYSFLNWSTTRRAKALKVGRRESCSSTNCFYAQYLHSSLYKMQNVCKGITDKNWYFLGIFPKYGDGGSGIPKLCVKFFWQLFLAKSCC